MWKLAVKHRVIIITEMKLDTFVAHSDKAGGKREHYSINFSNDILVVYLKHNDIPNYIQSP